MKMLLSLLTTMIAVNSYADCSHLLNSAQSKYECTRGNVTFDIKISYLNGYIMVAASQKIFGNALLGGKNLMNYSKLSCENNHLKSEFETALNIQTGDGYRADVRSIIETDGNGIKITRKAWPFTTEFNCQLVTNN